MPPFLAKPLVKYVGLPALLLLLVGGYTAGVYYTGYDHSAKATEAQLAKTYRNQIAKMQLQWIDDQAKLAELELHLSQDVRKVRTITQEVKVYVTPDKVEFCGPPVGVVGLLNDARRPGVPFTAAEPTDQSRAPSGISYTEQTEDTLDITQRYNALMLRHNDLVQWIRDNYAPADRPGLRGSLE